MKHKLRLAGMYFRFNLASILEYRASFFLSAATMFFNNATFLFFWGVLFDRMGGSIGGYDFRDLMFIWAASSAAFGLSNIVFGNLTNINETVVRGELDTYLLQPRNVLLSLLMSRMSFSAWGDLAYGVVLICLSGQGFRGILAFLLAMVTGGVVLSSIICVLQSTVFFLGDASFLANMSTNLAVNFTTYPEGIFPRAVRFLLYWLIPAQFIVHVPLRIARGVHAPVWVAAQLLAAAFFAGFAMWFFHRGLKKYESGNMLMTRL